MKECLLFKETNNKSFIIKLALDVQSRFKILTKIILFSEFKLEVLVTF